MASALALVHSRFSTNTFPSWELAHPYRMIAHNGEINTLQGNVNWMRARESQMASELFGEDLAKVLPVVRPGGSDSATFDNVLELLTLAGRSLPHAVMMMIPEAYRNRDAELPPELGGFYAFHSCFMEPWDGPAAIAFTDGRVIGATLDRNGLRPGRWLETTDGYVILGSEAGLLPVPASRISASGGSSPASCSSSTWTPGGSCPTPRSSAPSRRQRPYGAWFDEHTVHFDQLPLARRRSRSSTRCATLQLAFGYSREDLSVTLPTMVLAAEEPIGSMGADISLAALSDATPTLFDYFKQLFAQVTNPPIDPIREDIVMSIGAGLGAEGNLLDGEPEPRPPAGARPADPAQPRAGRRCAASHTTSSSRTRSTSPGRSPTAPTGWRRRSHASATRPTTRSRAAINILILSDRAVGPERAPIPVAAGRLRGPPPPRARGHAAADGPRDRDRRGAPGPPHRDADRLRRERRQPVADVRDRRRGGRRRSAGRRRRALARPRRGRDRRFARRSARAC